MKNKFTAGPWHTDGAVICGADTQIDVDGYCVAQLRQDIGRFTRNIKSDEVDANARLIAAAPELLEACKAALELFSAGHAIESFNWGKSVLRAQDIRELNELPQWLSRVIQKTEDGE